MTLAPDNIQGDLAFPCFKIAKDFAKSPVECASDLAQTLNEELSRDQFFSSFLAV
ncbi:MAG: hypothetical protein LBI53_08525 [Candidatus Peribacteria bacterium]|nr:hypothetical protein [Candidatus Peribacteria bacterium]